MEKMGKITIVSIEPKKSKTGVPFWACGDSLGEKFTVWDEELAKVIRMNLDKEINYDVKTTPTGFHNIRGISTSTKEVQGDITCSAGDTLKKVTSTNISIVAQCMVKAVLGQPVSFETKSKDTEEAVRMYKLAVKLLEE